MKKHQNIRKLAEMGGNEAEVNPRTPYTLLPQARNCNVCWGIRTSIAKRKQYAS